MAKYNVRVYLSTFIDVEVENAEDRDDAIDQARSVYSDLQIPDREEEIYGNLALPEDYDVEECN